MSTEIKLPLNGSGTQEDPWKITSEQDMLAVQKNLVANGGYKDQYFRITKDLVLGRAEPWNSDVPAWEGLGTAAIKDAKDTHSPYATADAVGFAGTLEGGYEDENGDLISGAGPVVIVHRTADNVSGVGGLVNYLAPSGVVKNLTVAGVLTVTGNELDAVGGVVAYNSGTVQNVTNQMVVTAIGHYNVGGVVGFNNGYYGTDGKEAANGTNKPKGVIEHCMNHASVMGYAKVGGITGEDSGMIQACANVQDNIYAEEGSKDGVGGIAGRNGNNDTAMETGIIQNCYNTGNIIDWQGGWIGGISGFQNSLSSSTNCYSIGKVLGYSYRDNIAGDNENKTGGVENSYGEGSASGEPLNGAQGYDGATLLTKEQIESVLANRLNGNAATGAWEQTTGELPHLVNCGNKTIEVSSTAFVINVISNPNALTYVAGEHFNPYGLIIQEIYENGKRHTLDLTDHVHYPEGALEAGDYTVHVSHVDYKDIYIFSFPVKVVAQPTGDIILNEGDAGCWGTLKGAIEAAEKASVATIYAAGTTALGNGTYKGAPITVKRLGGENPFTNVMFTIATADDYDTDAYDPNVTPTPPTPGPIQADDVTLEKMTLDGAITGGNAAASLIRISSGTLEMKGDVTLQNNTIPASDSSGDWKKADAERGAGLSAQGGVAAVAATFDGCNTVSGGAIFVGGANTVTTGDDTTETVDTVVNLTGSITGCQAEEGSAAYVQGVLNIKAGASISSDDDSSNTATKKGTVYVGYDENNKKPGQVVLEGGTISGNTVPAGSAEIHIEGGACTIKGGTITPKDGSYAIRVGNTTIWEHHEEKTINGTLTIAGAATINGGIYLESGTKITLNVVPGAVLNVTPADTASGTVIATCVGISVANCLSKIAVSGKTLTRAGSNIVIA